VTATRSLLRVDAFADRPGAGNPAAVVLDADGLTDRQMGAIAAGIALPGTAFLLLAARPDAMLGLRWFTPAREVAYSGHTTLAAVHALVEAGRLAGDRVTFDTRRGLLPVEVDRATGLIWLLPGVPTLRRFEGPLRALLDALGLRPGGLGRWARPSLTPESDLLLPIRGLPALRALEPDMAGLGRWAGEAAIRGICVVTTETVEPDSRSHCRFFAPHVGIPEDIVTGSVHSALALWLLEAGALGPSAGDVALTCEQGDGLGRPGRVRVEIRMDAGRPTAVRVGGRAVTVAQGTIGVP
jgi:PhzF family phenazine biosynthesis protein